MAEKDNNEVILGCGELFIQEFTGDKFADIPTDAEIEVVANSMGRSSGGSSFEYKPTEYEVVDSCGEVVKRFIVKEEGTWKSGILTWDIENLALLSPGVLTTTVQDTKNYTVVTLGGGKVLKSLLVRFVHTKADGRVLRLTMIGTAGNGFTLTFEGQKETVIDAEIKSINKAKGFLAEIREEISDAE